MKTSQLKLRTRLTILILAITTPIFWIVLAMVNSNAEHRLRQEATERLRETNQAIASNVSLWLDLHIRILKELTFMPDIISMDADRQAPVLDAVASTYPYFAIVHTTDLYGNDIVRSDGLELKNWSDRQWFKGAIAGSPITFESIVRRTTGKPAVAISMPIRDSSDEIVGVVQFNIELNNLTAEIEARQVGNAGYAYIVDVNNRVIAHPDPAYSTDLFDLSDYPPIVMLRNGQQGLINFEDDQGSLWQAYVEQLDNGWGIIVQQPEDELFSSLRVFQVTSLVFALSGTALLLLGSFFIVRRALKPIETLTDTVLAIAGGDLDRTAPVERMDEVGTLASAFNSMTTRIRELILSLEQRVDQLDQTHLALNESLLRQTAILDNIPDLAWLKDEESRFIAVNEPFGKACGVAPADIVGKTDLDIWPEELANGYQQDDFEVMRTGKRKEVEERLMDSSGSESWIETIKTPIFDANGEVIGTAGIARDITERKRSDAITRLRLRLFEYAANHSLGELLQKILDEVGELTGSPIGFYHFVGADQKTLSLQAWSTQTLEKFCRAEGQGMHYSIDEAGVWVDCVRERKAVIHNDYASLPHRKGLPDGHTPVIREMVVPILRHNRIVAILGVGNKSQDYTDQDAEIVTYLADVAWELAERKKIEEELRVSEQKFSKTFRSSPDSVTLSDLESGYLVEVNDGFQEVFGYSREEAIGRTTLELGLYQNPADRQKMVQTLREQGNISNLELTGVHKSGSVLTALLSVEMIEIGGKSHLITITRDITERKKAEEALRQANLVVESSPVMLFRWKAAEGWPVTLVSQNVMQLGYSAEELLNGSTSYASIVHPDDLERVNREVQEYSVNGVNRFQQEYRIITKAGKVRWIDDRTVVEQDSDGQITHYQGIVVDITERKHAEEALRLNEERYRTLAQNLPDSALLLFDQDLRFMIADGPEIEATGFSREMLEGKTLQEALPTEFAQLVEPNMRRTLAGEKLYAELPYEDRFYQYSYVPLRDSSGNVGMGMILATNITERKLAEEERERLINELEAKNAEAETLRESAAAVALSLDLDETVERILDQLQRVVPYDSASIQLLIGDELEIIGGRGFPEGREAMGMKFTLDEADAAYPIIKEGLPYIFYPNVQTASDKFKDSDHDHVLSWMAIPLYARGGLIGMFALDGFSVNKFTKEHAEFALTFANHVAITLENSRLFTTLQAELALSEGLVAELEDKNAELERFTYTVSHDLKSPLITIRGFLGYLEKDAIEGNIERLKSDIERISKATGKMQQLLDELLELSRIGRLMNEPEEVSFETIVLEAVNLVEGQLKEGNIEVEIGSDFPKVYGDRVRLVEVVQNLVDNAVKFTKEQPKPKIEIGARDNDRETSFYVKDNGIGIDPKYHKKIFSLFEKLDSSSEGTGVGLALVKRIVEVHGGRIWVESEAGEGATFCFTLSRTPKFE